MTKTHYNSRRVMLEHLKVLRNMVSYARDRWTVQGTVAEMADDNMSCTWRKRRPEEYPENQVSEWQLLDEVLSNIIEQATLARSEVHLQLRALERGEVKP